MLGGFGLLLLPFFPSSAVVRTSSSLLVSLRSLVLLVTLVGLLLLAFSWPNSWSAWPPDRSVWASLLRPRVPPESLPHGPPPLVSSVALPPARFVPVREADRLALVVFASRPFSRSFASLLAFALLRGSLLLSSQQHRDLQGHCPCQPLPLLPAWDRSSSSVPIPIPRFCDLCIRLRSKTAFVSSSLASSSSRSVTTTSFSSYPFSQRITTVPLICSPCSLHSPLPFQPRPRLFTRCPIGLRFSSPSALKLRSSFTRSIGCHPSLWIAR